MRAAVGWTGAVAPRIPAGERVILASAMLATIARLGLQRPLVSRRYEVYPQGGRSGPTSPARGLEDRVPHAAFGYAREDPSWRDASCRSIAEAAIRRILGRGLGSPEAETTSRA